ncbi:unnamed protein product [Symbiodinium pilosum]|uniref:Uncharacterized protein n=1 Tax=Symbiodinium pilosum TaxID=2952 RepID=A0A812YP21_SYMPI|nr:unnamed protein product [Symbiodinium pilosum]
MASQCFWFKIVVGGSHEADFVHYAEDDIVASIKHKIIRQNPRLSQVNPGELTLKAASGEAALAVDSKISLLVAQGYGAHAATAVLVDHLPDFAGAAIHPRAAPTAAVQLNQLSLCEEVLGAVQQEQWIRCRISYRSTDYGIKARLSDHVEKYFPGALGGTVQRRENVTVVTIQGTYHSVRSLLEWMQTHMPYPRDATSKTLIIQAKYKQFKVLKSHPEPRSEHSSGNVADEGSSVSSRSDARTPSRIS